MGKKSFEKKKGKAKESKHSSKIKKDKHKKQRKEKKEKEVKEKRAPNFWIKALQQAKKELIEKGVLPTEDPKTKKNCLIVASAKGKEDWVESKREKKNGDEFIRRYYESKKLYLRASELKEEMIASAPKKENVKITEKKTSPKKDVKMKEKEESSEDKESEYSSSDESSEDTSSSE